MSLDPKLLEILRCPADRGLLDYDEPGQRLTCQECGNRYRVIDGAFPDMLTEDAEPSR